MDTLPREIATIIVRSCIYDAPSYINTVTVCKEWYGMVDHSAMEF